jgi:hypothetical protein
MGWRTPNRSPTRGQAPGCLTRKGYILGYILECSNLNLLDGVSVDYWPIGAGDVEGAKDRYLRVSCLIGLDICKLFPLYVKRTNSAHDNSI